MTEFNVANESIHFFYLNAELDLEKICLDIDIISVETMNTYSKDENKFNIMRKRIDSGHSRSILITLN